MAHPTGSASADGEVHDAPASAPLNGDAGLKGAVRAADVESVLHDGRGPRKNAQKEAERSRPVILVVGRAHSTTQQQAVGA